MACEIITKTNEAWAAFTALCGRCCDDSSACSALVDSNESCVFPLIKDIQLAVAQLLDTGLASCTNMVASIDYPLPDLPTCMSGAFLVSLKDCIENITCESEDDICSLDLDSSGGDEGFDAQYDAGGGGYTIILTYETYWQKDQVILYGLGGATLFDSGCVGTAGSREEHIVVPSGTVTIRVRVIPNCEGGSGTAWWLKVRCE